METKTRNTPLAPLDDGDEIEATLVELVREFGPTRGEFFFRRGYSLAAARHEETRKRPVAKPTTKSFSSAPEAKPTAPQKLKISRAAWNHYARLENEISELKRRLANRQRGVRGLANSIRVRAGQFQVFEK